MVIKKFDGKRKTKQREREEAEPIKSRLGGAGGRRRNGGIVAQQRREMKGCRRDLHDKIDRINYRAFQKQIDLYTNLASQANQ